MTSFSEEWLSLREPLDNAARASEVIDAFVAALPKAPHLVDLAGGTGASIRALAARLPQALWRLVDHDPTLLKAAAHRFAGWTPPITFSTVDLAVGVATVLDETSVDGIVTSAFFDLVSQDWLDGFIADVASHRLPVLAMLTYDGRMHFEPTHRADEAVCAAFNRHQRGDKGFGLALGPNAAPTAIAALKAAGYMVTQAHSDWTHRPDNDDVPAGGTVAAKEAAFWMELLAGITAAAGEAGVDPHDADAWRAARVDDLNRGRLMARIGHIDLAAIPPT